MVKQLGGWRIINFYCRKSFGFLTNCTRTGNVYFLKIYCALSWRVFKCKIKTVILTGTLHYGWIFLLDKVIPIVCAVQEKIGFISVGTYNTYILILNISYLKVFLSVWSFNNLGNNFFVLIHSFSPTYSSNSYLSFRFIASFAFVLQRHRAKPIPL